MCACLCNHRTCALHHAYECLRLPRTPISMLLYMVGQVDTRHGACIVGCRQGKLAFRSTLKSGVRGWFSKVEFLPTTRGRSGEREQGVREVSSYDIRHPSQQPSQAAGRAGQPVQPVQLAVQPATPAQPANLPSQPSQQPGGTSRTVRQPSQTGQPGSVTWHIGQC